MFFFKKLIINLRSSNWFTFFSTLQKFFAYLPLVVVPWIFSPLSSDPFYNDKLIIIILCSSFSLIFLCLNLILFKSKNSKKKETGTPIYFSKLIFYFIVFLFFTLLSQIYSINFNQSFWGVGTILILSLLLWIICIYQVFNISLIKATFILGVTILSVINLTVLITRFSGNGIWEIINVQSFSGTGDYYSLLFLLFISLYFCITSSFQDEYKYLFISGFFLNLTTFIIYAFFTNIYLFCYLILFVLLASYFIPYISIKKINKHLFFISYKKELDYKKENQNIKLEKKLSNKINFSITHMLFFKNTVIISSILIGIFEIFLQKSVIFTDRSVFPINFSWSVFIKGFTESFKNIFLGVGPNSYGYSFLHFKPVDIDSTPFWANTYSTSLHGGFEFLTNFGLGFILICISLFIYKLYKRPKNLKLIKKITYLFNVNKFISLVFCLCIIFLFFLTPLRLTSFFGIIVLLLIYYENPKKITITLNSSNKVNIDYSKILIYIYSAIVVVPSLIFIYYFSVGSIFLGLGYAQIDTEKINRGLVTFPYYSKNFNVAVNLSSKIKNDTILSSYSNSIKNYSKINVQLNPYDPEANLSLIQSYLTYKPDYSSSLIVESLYQNLISIAPHHLPYFIGLADIESQLGNIDSAANLLDQILNRIPTLNIALIKRANIYYSKNDYDNVRVICNYLIQSAKDDGIKSAAQSLLDKVGVVPVKK